MSAPDPATIDAVAAAPEPGSVRWVIAHSLMYTLPDVMVADTRRAVEHLAEALERHGHLRAPADEILTEALQIDARMSVRDLHVVLRRGRFLGAYDDP